MPVCVCLHHSSVAGVSKEGRLWNKSVDGHVRALVLLWCEWLQENRSSSASAPCSLVWDAVDAVVMCLKGSTVASIQDCVWRVWAAFVISNSNATLGDSASGIVDAIISSHAHEVTIPFPANFFASPDSASVSPVQSSSSAAAAFAKSLSILTSGFAVVRASGAGQLQVSIDTTQYGEPFAMMLLSICGSSGGSSGSTSVASLVNELQSILLTCRYPLWDSTVLRLTRASALISNVMGSQLPPSPSSLSLISMIMTGSGNLSTSASMSSVDSLRLLWML